MVVVGGNCLVYMIVDILLVGIGRWIVVLMFVSFGFYGCM